MSTTTLLRTELMEPLGQIGDDTASGVVMDLLNNLEMANQQLERNISSILEYFSSLAVGPSSPEEPGIAKSAPAKSLGQMLETGLPSLMQHCKSIRQRDGMTSDVDVIVDFGKHSQSAATMSNI
jgi:hypothetical protein